MATPHDDYVLTTFSDTAQFAAWLRWLIPGRLATCIDWSTLRRAAERQSDVRLHTGMPDLVYVVDFLDAEGEVHAFMEHRSFAGPDLHDAALRYGVHLLRSARRQRNRVPTAVLGLVLAHGRGGLDLRSRLQADLPEAAAVPWLPWQPTIHLLTDDLSIATEAELMARPLLPAGRLTLIALRFLPNLPPSATVAAIGRWAVLLQAVYDEDRSYGSEHLDAFCDYLLQVNETPAKDVQMALDNNLKAPVTVFVSTAEKLREKGRVEGVVQTLQRILARRFGPLPADAAARIASASLEQLDAWTQRVLDVDSLQELFAAGPDQ